MNSNNHFNDSDWLHRKEKVINCNDFISNFLNFPLDNNVCVMIPDPTQNICHCVTAKLVNQTVMTYT